MSIERTTAEDDLKSTSRSANVQRSRLHRRDIEGLRAIAVLSVIMYHAGITKLSSGFLGVDVFFVISGYLIFKDLFARARAGTAAPFEFYGRRIRRTFPALCFVVMISFAVSALLLMPGDFVAAARSGAAALLSISNVLFFKETGYFDHDAGTKLLLHTWSLGVEQQFYLLAPLLPFAISKVPERRRHASLIGLSILGFVFCVALQAAAPAAAFFLPPGRFWEFSIGCIVAVGAIPAIRRRWPAELLGGSAIVALLGSMTWFSESSAHPGFPTLIPCIATAALIHIGTSTRTLAGRLLSVRLVGFVGLISYSLYLWHWPLIVFYRYADLPETPALEMTGACALLALSILTCKYVETPFRDPASPLRRHAASILPAGLGLVLVSAATVIAARGLPERFPANVAAIASYYDYEDRREFREGSCFITSKLGSVRYFDKAMCLKNSSKLSNYLLIGDSQAAQLWIGLSQVFPNVNIMQATASGCKPTLPTSGEGYCVDLMTYALAEFLPATNIDGVIFSAAWTETDAEALKRVVAYVHRFSPRAVVLGRLPLHDIALPNLIARSLFEDRPDLIINHQSTDPQRVDDSLKKLIDKKDYVSLVDLLCPDNKCIVYASKTAPIQFDKSHLTTEGSIFLAKQLKSAGLL